MKSERKEAIKILVVDSRPADTHLLRTILNEKRSRDLKLEYVTSVSAALEKLEDQRFDALLFTLRTSVGNQVAALRKLVSNRRKVPVLIAGPHQTETTLEKFLKSGCVAYLNLDHLTFEQFWFSVQNAVHSHMKETLLFERLQRLELAIEGSTNGLFDWIVPPDWQNHFNSPAWFSDRFKYLLGINGNNPDSRWSDWLSQVHLEDQSRVIREIKTCIKNHSTCDIECRLMTKHRGLRWFRIRGRAVREGAGSAKRFSGSLIDINERKESQLALQSSEAKFRTIFENSAVGITLVDADEKIISLNSFMEQLLGYGTKELYLRPVSSLYPSEEWKRIRSYHLRKIGMKPHLETKMIKKDGVELDVDISITILKDSAGRKIGSIGITRDISERKQNEAEFQKIREEALVASRAKSDFLANMSHEIRTPLNAIIGFSELLQSTQMDERQADYSNTIRDSAQLLLELISDILDISKIEARQIELEAIDFSLRELVEGLLKIVSKKAKSNSVELCYDLGANVPERLIGDPLRIRQILLNLLGNAVKFTHKGQVGVFVKCVRGMPEEESSGIKTLLISVKDTGIGISRDKQDQIFQPFMQADTSTTRKFGGTGLGLAISKALVQMMGGRLWLESNVGKGSEFFFTVKLREAKTGAVKSIPILSVDHLKNKKILIVDDYEMAQRIAEIYCRELGMEVIAKSCSVADALSWMNRNYENEKLRPDLVLCDIRIPDADGFEFAKRLRMQDCFAKTKLIAMSLDVTPAVKQKSKEAGFDLFLAKPIIRNELMKSIQSVFSNGHASCPSDDSPMTKLCDRSLRHLSILVAEDNLVNQKLMGEMLSALGCAFEFAATGKEAVEKIRKNAYDLVLMDLQMPEMGGLEAARVIRSDISKTLPIVALTAAAMKDDQVQSLESGMNDYISKPVNFSKLKEKIISHTKSQPTAQK